jgi:magnesium transporter
MLTLYDGRAARGRHPADLGAADLPPGVVWIDLVNPDAAEIAFVEGATGLHVPSKDELSEIESSSRLRSRDGSLYLSTPLIYRTQSDLPLSTPVGFVLTPDRLITVRFEKLTAFTNFIDRELAADNESLSSGAVFVELMDAIADRLADVLEHIAEELDTLSHWLFRVPAAQTMRRRPPARESADLRVILRRVGGYGDLVSKIRDSLLGIGRIAPYVASACAQWLSPEIKRRLDTLRQDVLSLSDYDTHLVKKVQLLLDATLGLISV